MAKKNYKKKQAIAVMIPISVYYLGLMIVPVIMLFYYSFTDLSVLYGTEKFVGFKNYIDVFIYPEYMRAFWVTLLLAAFLLVIGTFAAFLIAVLLNNIKKGSSFFRTIWYIPTLLSMAVVSELFNIMLRFDGVINNIIDLFNGSRINLHDSTFWMYFWIIILNTWKGMGGTVLIILSALKGINTELYEAAKIDGANRSTIFRKITLPLLKPILGFVLITGGIGAFSVYEPVLLISGGGPDASTKVLLFSIYEEAFTSFKQGFASAMSVLLLIFIMIFTVISMKITDRSLITGKTEE